MNLWLYGAAALPPIMRGCLAPPCESLTAGGMRAVAPSIAPKRCGARSATARSPPQRVPSLRGRSALITQNFPSPPHSPLPTTLTLFQIDTIISYLYLISIYLSINLIYLIVFCPDCILSLIFYPLPTSAEPSPSHRPNERESAAVGSMAVPARRASSAGHPWGRLVCTGTKESKNDRIVDFFEVEIKIGRKDECQVQYKGNMTISSVHCKISVENHPETGVQVRIEDTSSNGTYVNTQHLGKHKSCQLSQNDEVRLLTNDAQNEHFGDFVYTFQARTRSEWLGSIITHAADPAVPRRARRTVRTTCPTPCSTRCSPSARSVHAASSRRR